MTDITNNGIEKMAKATVNREDSHAGQIVHIAAYKTGAEWYRQELRERIKNEISDLQSEQISWRDQNCQQLAHNCAIRISTHKGVLEMMNDTNDL